MKALHFLALMLLIAFANSPGLAEDLGGRRVIWDTDKLSEE